jgi:hypothetical protein
MLENDILEEYLDRDVLVHYAPLMVGAGAPAYEAGKLQSYSRSGVLLEQEDGMVAYIPYTSIRMLQIKPKPSFWQRLTGS